MTYTLLQRLKLPNRPGFDVTVNFLDKTKNVDKNVTFYWEGKTEPTLLAMDARLKHIESNINDSLVEEAPTTLEKEEVEKILKEKGLLTEAQTWEDFKNG